MVTSKVSAVGPTRWLQRDQTLPLFEKGVACETKMMSMYLRITLLNLLHSSVASSNHWPWFDGKVMSVPRSTLETETDFHSNRKNCHTEKWVWFILSSLLLGESHQLSRSLSHLHHRSPRLRSLADLGLIVSIRKILARTFRLFFPAMPSYVVHVQRSGAGHCEVKGQFSSWMARRRLARA